VSKTLSRAPKVKRNVVLALAARIQRLVRSVVAMLQRPLDRVIKELELVLRGRKRLKASSLAFRLICFR
jgi:hypothetical protein